MRLLYLYPWPVEESLRKYSAGSIASDRLYGLIELRKRGFSVDCATMHTNGPFKKWIGRINRMFGLNIVNPKTLLKLLPYDTIIVKDGYSTLMTLACFLVRKRIVYVDALFRIPQNPLRKFLCYINIRLASGTVVYSKTQMKIWAQLFTVPSRRLKVMPYCMDVSFYAANASHPYAAKPYILSVGRDIGRDYPTLTEAVKGLDIHVKIVSLRHLLGDNDACGANVELLEYIPDEILFKLYREAVLVVLPLKKWATQYPSGIRGLFEALHFGKCVIASRSPVLEEYFRNGDGVVYVAPENGAELRKAIQRLLDNPGDRSRLENRAAGIIQKKYNMDVFADRLGRYLQSLAE